jgi:hypothetical protein
VLSSFLTTITIVPPFLSVGPAGGRGKVTGSLKRPQNVAPKIRPALQGVNVCGGSRFFLQRLRSLSITMASPHHRHQSSLEGVLDFSSPQPLEPDQRNRGQIAPGTIRSTTSFSSESPYTQIAPGIFAIISAVKVVACSIYVQECSSLTIARAIHNIAALGALITIVAIAIDPFSQQIIQYYSCKRPIAGAQPSLATTNIYTGGFSLINDDSDFITSPAMNAAIYVGLLDPPANSSSNLNFGCPTGNCTFPATNGASYSSLAICSRCSDISRSIRNETRLEGGVVAYNYTIPSVQIMGPNYVVLGSAVVGPMDFSMKTAESIVDIDFLMVHASDQGHVLNRPFASSCSLMRA